MTIIEVNHVTKEYRLGQLQSLRISMQHAFARLRGKHASTQVPFKALDDVDFKIKEGEVLGIIGRNGAGKSTLLKILARISAPTHGSVTVRGQVAPLIEVGAGLVGDLTGRENVYLNAAILGMPRTEIDKRFDEIVAFAELEEFIDTPLKRYSSGMAVRLGFAVATSVDANILIVDEVLAVGDLAFQRKCFDRMEEIIKRQGKTVLLVSHNIRQVERICSRVILLDHGKILEDGRAANVCDKYFSWSNERIHETTARTAKGIIKTSGEAEVLTVETLDSAGHPTDEVRTGGALHVRVAFVLKQRLEQPEFVVGTHTTDFFYLTGSSTAVFDNRPNLEAGRHEIELVLPSFPLVSGVYSIRFAILDRSRRVIFAGDNLRTFLISPGSNEAKEEELRVLNLPANWVLDGRRLQKATSAQDTSGISA